MTGEIISTKLLCRIKTKLGKIIYPGRKCIPVLGRIISITLYLRESRTKNNHVATFFHGHVGPISHSICKRIFTHIMRRERLGPLSAFAIIENRVKKSFHKFGIVEEEHGSRRISHIHSSDRSIGKIFFRQPEQIAV